MMLMRRLINCCSDSQRKHLLPKEKKSENKAFHPAMLVMAQQMKMLMHHVNSQSMFKCGQHPRLLTKSQARHQRDPQPQSPRPFQVWHGTNLFEVQTWNCKSLAICVTLLMLLYSNVSTYVVALLIRGEKLVHKTSVLSLALGTDFVGIGCIHYQGNLCYLLSLPAISGTCLFVSRQFQQQPHNLCHCLPRLPDTRALETMSTYTTSQWLNFGAIFLYSHYLYIPLTFLISFEGINWQGWLQRGTAGKFLA